MEKEFIPYELAVKLKELGFDKKCFDVYPDTKSKGKLHSTTPRNRTPKILWQQAFEFFREKYDLDGTITSWKKGGSIEFLFSTERTGSPSIYRNSFVSYEEARLECLKKLIEISENNE